MPLELQLLAPQEAEPDPSDNVIMIRSRAQTYADFLSSLLDEVFLADEFTFPPDAHGSADVEYSEGLRLHVFLPLPGEPGIPSVTAAGRWIRCRADLDSILALEPPPPIAA
jgi:hypothetical protein